MLEKTQLHNAYVKDFYDAHVGALPETYENTRWHADVTGEFDYRQTKRAIIHALGTRLFKNGIEVGPGDSVWTGLLRKHVSGMLHLVEQSEAMLEQAKVRIGDTQGFSFERSDWMDAQPPAGVGILYTIRCFEYFRDKPGALKKMLETLAPGGTLILITKNADQYTTVNVQGKTLHSDQVTREQMTRLLLDAGFTIEEVYPATFRWKARWLLMRVLFDALQKLMVVSGGGFRVPLLERYATESYLYRAKKPNV